jgi:cell division protein FtsN
VGAVYRVRVGRRYSSEAEAARAQNEFFKDTGVGSELVRVGDSYRLQVGSYGSRDAAEDRATEIRKQNYLADVSEGRSSRRRRSSGE